MRITNVKTVLLTGPLTGDPYVLEVRRLRSAALIEIHTDGPYVGVGETYAGYWFPEAVPAIVAFYKPILMGVDLADTDIHTLWQRMFTCGSYWGRVGLGPAVLSGIEAALWDLKGKMLDMPVYELLGGKCHDRLPAYATGSVSNWPADRLKAKIDSYLELGFRAFKVATGYYDGLTHSPVAVRAPSEAADMEADKAEMMRKHVGREVDICLDGHMDSPLGDPWDVSTARAVLKAVEPYDIFFFEEPLPYTNPWGYAELNRSTSIRVAGGETLTTLNEFRQYADLDALSMAQPDAAWVGGLTEFIRVARLFDARSQKIATHSWGAGVAQMQNIHAGFASPNTAILEIPPAAGPLHTELWGDSFVMHGGHVLPPSAPGLGVQLTEETKERFPFVPGSGEFSSVPGKVLST